MYSSHNMHFYNVYTRIYVLFTLKYEQQTVNFIENKEATLAIKGRHDPAIVHRARAVQDAVTAIALADALLLRFGTDWLKNE